jgi:Flp pilus assembly protein TadD
VKVWDADKGKEMLALQGHTQGVLAVAFSPDGTRLASASYDQTVRLWDADTGQQLRALQGHTGRVWGVAFSPDGTRLASASEDQTVRLWDARTGAEGPILSGHTGDVDSVAFSPDGTRLASASYDKTVRLWDTRTEADAGGFDPWAEDEQQRRALAPRWHAEDAERAEEANDWFAAVFHRARLCEIQPHDDRNWTKLEQACRKRGNLQPLQTVCDRLLTAGPGLAPVYLRRARVALLLGHKAPALADAGRALLQASRTRLGWPAHAKEETDLGDKAAGRGEWSQARTHFALASLWQPSNTWYRHNLAWAEAAADDNSAARQACQRLFEDYRDTRDVEPFYRLSAELAAGLSLASPFARLAGRPVADMALDRILAEGSDDVAYTASLFPDSGIPPADLVALAERAVRADKTSSAYQETLGASLYRAVRFEDAVRTLEQAVKLHGKGGSLWMKLFLALAHQRLGHADDARTWHEQAKLPEDAGWQDRLIHRELSRELEALRRAGDK